MLTKTDYSSPQSICDCYEELKFDVSYGLTLTSKMPQLSGRLDAYFQVNEKDPDQCDDCQVPLQVTKQRHMVIAPPHLAFHFTESQLDLTLPNEILLTKYLYFPENYWLTATGQLIQFVVKQDKKI